MWYFTQLSFYLELYGLFNKICFSMFRIYYAWLGQQCFGLGRKYLLFNSTKTRLILILNLDFCLLVFNISCRCRHQPYRFSVVVWFMSFNHPYCHKGCPCTWGPYRYANIRIVSVSLSVQHLYLKQQEKNKLGIMLSKKTQHYWLELQFCFKFLMCYYVVTCMLW